MAQYKIQFDRRALKDFKSITPQDARRIKIALASLADNPRPPGCKKMKGQKQDYFRIRIGNYRAIYAIEEKVLIVIVVRVGPRGQIYKDL